MKEETEKTELGPIVQSVVLNAMVGYRSLLMLMAILEGRHGEEEALQCISDIICMHPGVYIVRKEEQAQVKGEIIKYIALHRKQISYASLDIRWVLERKFNRVALPSEETRISMYLSAMEEQCRCLAWELSPFNLPAYLGDDMTITDVGCSNFGFAELLMEANKGRITRYNAVDKREIKAHRIRAFKEKYKIIVSARQVDVREETGFLDDEVSNTLFMGNSLHCMANPTNILKKVLNNEKIPVIMIIEPTVHGAHAYGFEFHMRIHGEHTTLKPDFFEKTRGFRGDTILDVLYPNKYFTMYRYTRKR